MAPETAHSPQSPSAGDTTVAIAPPARDPPRSWRGFGLGPWTETIAVRDFIQRNYAPYAGDGRFLADSTERTRAVWGRLSDLMAAERERGGVLDVDESTPSSITAYTPEILAARSAHLITGLPDAYGRRRIIGDYRRVALYGTDRLIAGKREDRAGLDGRFATEPVIRLREELAEQIRALGELAEMAAAYGFDITRPAETAREAIHVLDRAALEDTMEHPDRCPQLTIRVSGYAVNFIRLTREQQLDVLGRTFHGRL